MARHVPTVRYSEVERGSIVLASGTLQFWLMRHERKLTRLPHYDYRQGGAYFITICTHQHLCVFGRVDEGQMRLNRFGCVVYEEWLHTVSLRSYLTLDEFVVMPNHFHAILFLALESGAEPNELRQFGQPQAQSLGTVVGAFKSAVTRRIGILRGSETRVWQSRFHEHIIRHDRDMEHHRQYIIDNPSKWCNDELNSHDS